MLSGYFHRLAAGKDGGLVAEIFRIGLKPLGGLYGIAASLRNELFNRGWKRIRQVDAAVVSIGNLTLGGTGKTPAVEYAARFYADRGNRTAILSRGYGGRGESNDEGVLLRRSLPGVPHLQGPDRVSLAEEAIQDHRTEVLVLDDGFQHRRLARDLDIVLIDATNPWGYGRLFPAGLLRESPRGLRRANVVLLTRCDQVEERVIRELRAEIGKWAPEIPVAESIHAPVRLSNHAGDELKLAALRGRAVAGFCGIGNPMAFRQTLGMLGCRTVAFEVFPDHCSYAPRDMNRLQLRVEQLPADVWIVTTQKDLVKLPLAHLGGRPLWAVQIALQITAGKEAFDRKLEGVLRERIDRRSSIDRAKLAG